MSDTHQREYEPGDMVYSVKALYNDGSIPVLPEHAIVAEQGARGVVINIGHLEEPPQQTLYLVRFENEEKTLGPPIGCWPDEITDASEENT